MVVMSIDRDLRFNHCCLVIAMFVAPSICNCKVGVRVCAMCVCVCSLDNNLSEIQ